MNKLIRNAGLFITAVTMLTGCNEPIVWEDNVGLVGFSTNLITMAEGEAITLGVFFSAPTGADAIDVNLAVSTTGIAVPATEGTDYTISSKTFNMEIGTENITITATDDNNFTGNKSFYLAIASTSGNYPFAMPNPIKVIILEDEHPLTAWVGTYNIKAVSYYEAGTYDEDWLSVTTDVVPLDPTKLQIRGIAASGSGPVVATLNTSTMTISIQSGQALGQPYGPENGNISVYYGTDDIIANNWMPITPDMLAAAAAVNITGTLQANGDIVIDKFAEVNPDELWVYDVYHTTWTKQK